MERHQKSGRIGLGLLKGLNLKQGAIATSIAHDSHHIITAGANPEDMTEAVRAVVKMQGGIVAVRDGEIIAKLALPVIPQLKLTDKGLFDLTKFKPVSQHQAGNNTACLEPRTMNRPQFIVGYLTTWIIERVD